MPSNIPRARELQDKAIAMLQEAQQLMRRDSPKNPRGSKKKTEPTPPLELTKKEIAALPASVRKKWKVNGGFETRKVGA